MYRNDRFIAVQIVVPNAFVKLIFGKHPLRWGAVSYTHLDVYKRQDVESTDKFLASMYDYDSSEIKPNNGYTANKSMDLLIEEIDVYKRQEMQRPSALKEWQIPAFAAEPSVPLAPWRVEPEEEQDTSYFAASARIVNLSIRFIKATPEKENVKRIYVWFYNKTFVCILQEKFY